MVKTPLSNKIEESVFQCFEKLYKDLGPPKNRILEACIETFNALPREFQYRLKGNNQKDRETILTLLSNLSLPQNDSSVKAAIDDENAAQQTAVMRRRTDRQRRSSKS